MDYDIHRNWGNTTRVIKETVRAIATGFKEDSPKANETNYNLFSTSQASPAEQLLDYQNKVVNKARSTDSYAFYPSSTYAQYTIKPAYSNILPLSNFGRSINHFMDVASLNNILKQGIAKLLQIFILVGFVYALFRRTYLKDIDSTYAALLVGCIIFIALQILLPFISVEYGLLRAFQQSLILLGLLVVLGTCVLFNSLPGTWLKQYGPAIVSVMFFLASTGFISQLLGGYQAQLGLNNAGTYYDIYYLHKAEVVGINWLSETIKSNKSTGLVQSEVQTDRYSLSKVQSLSEISPLNDIYPGLVRKNSYIYLGYSNIHKQQATVLYNGNLVTYTYPLDFLDQNKNLIYNNGGVRIYR